MRNNRIGLPPLNGMRTFIAVCRRMSFTAAAEDLCLTQSAVSRQVQTLERALGVTLFTRGHRAVSLTPAGAELQRIVDPLVSGLARFCAEHSNRPMRTVTITASIGVMGLWLLPRLGKFHAAHPDIDIRVATNNRVMDLAAERVDLAIRYARDPGAPGGGTRLFGERVIPVIRADLKSAFAEPPYLLDQILLEFEDRARPWLSWSEWLAALELEGRRPKGFMRFNQYDQVIAAALQGQGVALGRLPLVGPMIADGRLAPAPWPVGESDFAYWLVRGPDERRDVQTVANWILEEA
jgi:DNA-binding transcriptional LysR family regulator